MEKFVLLQRREHIQEWSVSALHFWHSLACEIVKYSKRTEY